MEKIFEIKSTLFAIILVISTMFIMGCSFKPKTDDKSSEITVGTSEEVKENVSVIEECSEKEKELLIDLDTFTGGYEEADFDRFNSPASENGLGNTLIWIRGTFKNYTESEYPLGDDIDTMSVFYLEDEKGTWMCIFESKLLGSQFDRIKTIVGDELIVKGIYQGFSEKTQKPALNVVEFYDVDSGNTYSSLLGNSLLEE